MNTILSIMPAADVAALAWLIVSWLGYTYIADSPQANTRPVARVLHEYRLTWMRRMLDRENRMADVQIVSAYGRTGSLFASTTILIIAGIITMFGSVDKARAVVSGLSFASSASRELWEIKVIVMLIIFVYGFFKFAWCIRQFNYALILIGAAPLPAECLPHDREAYPHRTATLISRGITTFNRGLRTYYFGLATLTWFLNPALFAVTIVGVLGVLYRRDFRSATFRAIQEADAKIKAAEGLPGPGETL